MRAVALSLICIALGCVESQPFTCTDDDACGPAGECEPEGFCSFADSSCHTGRRFGEHAPNDVGGVCVGVRGAPIQQLSAGGEHTCVLDQAGTIWCWGRNSDGALGNGGWDDTSTPSALILGVGIEAIFLATGKLHSCAVASDGAVYCWGDNRGGQLGDGSLAAQSEPVQVSGLTGAVAVAAGRAHTCALTAGGEVWCWGSNDAGQLGDGTDSCKLIPVRLPLSGIVEVALGSEHSCARAGDGRVWCWGGNEHGQLGTGDERGALLPVEIASLSDSEALALGREHTCALMDHEVRCTGRNDAGQLGDGNTDRHSTPVRVRGLGNAVEVAAGHAFTCARVRSGQVYCWGDGDSGELGNGGPDRESQPDKPVKLRLDAAAIVAGEEHACALTTDGCLWCWGDNDHGQLGSDDRRNSNKPVPVRMSCPGTDREGAPDAMPAHVTSSRRNK